MYPPKLPLRFFRWFCHPSLKKYIEGDLLELYEERRKSNGKTTADIKFTRDVLLLFRRGIIRPAKRFENQNHYSMFKNYLKIALRTLKHNKSYAFINVMGLALGLAATIIILLVVKNELSYDAYHVKSDRTFRVTMNALDFNPSVAFAIAPAFRNDFPEADHVSQYFYRNGALMKIENTLYDEKEFAYADNEFAAIFDLAWISGDPKTALRDPNTTVLTEHMALKYFGTTDVLGKMIRMDNRTDLQVTGVIKDLPSNTHFVFNFLVSWETIRQQVNSSAFYSIAGGSLYVTFPDPLAAKGAANRMQAFIRKNWGADIAKEAKLLLQPLTEIHFDKRYLSQVSMPRSKESIYGLAGVGLFIILTACINFVNLATAQSVKRVKEIGVRKSLGAYRRQLIAQVLTEITLLVIVSVSFALAGVYAFLPSAKALLDVSILPSQLLSTDFMTVMGAITIVTILIAGLYPAIVQSALQPIKALKPGAVRLGDNSFFRKSLVVVQFSITQLLLVATVIAGSQMNFFINQDIGFDKDAIISFPVGSKPDVLHQKLKEMSGIEEVSFASAAPAYNFSFAPFSSPGTGMTEVDVTELKMVDENYMSMFRIKLLAGEPVTKQHDGDTILNVVVNETLIKRMGIPDPEKAIGRTVFIGQTPNIIKGVIQDFQSESKHKKIRALIMLYSPDNFRQASVKLSGNNVRQTIASIDEAWKELNPEWLFSYEFLDEHIAKQYRQEESMYNTFRMFSGIAIVIGCLGLYGFVSSIAAQRTKEIGIRKVLGASVSGILILFFKQFIWLIVIAFSIAAPLGWYAMDSWLQEFAYRIPISPGIFILSIVTSILIAGLTVSYQTVRAALANPVKSLRTE